MAVIARTLPLLKLPTKLQAEVLNNMNFMEKFLLSWCSIRAKTLIRNQKVAIQHIDVYVCKLLVVVLQIDEDNSVYFRICAGPTGIVNNLSVEESNTTFVSYSSKDDGLIQWTIPQLSIKDYICYTMDIYHRRCLNRITFATKYFELTSLPQFFDGLVFSCLFIGPPQKLFNYLEVIPKFIEYRKKIMIYGTPCRDSNSFLRVLNRTVGISSFDKHPIVTMDSLLLMNSRCIILQDTHLPTKDFNRFIKLWISGLNSALEYLEVNFLNADEPTFEERRNILLRNIQYTANDTFRRIQSDHMDFILNVYEGYDIRRNDHTKATLSFKRTQRRQLLLQFVVWR